VEDIDGHARALAWFDAEHQVLLAALKLAADHGLDTCAWQLPMTLETFFYRRGHWHDWAAAQRIGLAAAMRLGDAVAQAYAHRGIANACIELGSFADAERHLAEALRLRVDCGDLAAQARLHLDMARMRNRQDRDAEALSHAELGLRMFHAACDQVGEADALTEVGWDLCLLGDYRAAITRCERALELIRHDGNCHTEAHAWDTLGYAHRHLGHHGEAAACYRRAVEILGELGSTHHAAVTLTYSGDAYEAAGDDDAARQAWQQALAIFEQMHHSDAIKIRAKLRAQVRHGRHPRSA
jgi:tetratricopeptide (TPR) repeat protein